MRKWALWLLVPVAIIGLLAAYLVLSTPRKNARVSFPLTPSQRQLLGYVPLGADSFALIPTAAAFRVRLAANPVTAEVMEAWSQRESLPPLCFLGGADVVIWRADGQTGYAVDLDSLRATLLRLYLLVGGNMEARWNGSTLIVSAPIADPLNAPQLTALLALANGMEPADALAVQLDRSRGSFPPVGRPAVTTVRVEPKEIVLFSRAADEVVSERTGVVGKGLANGALLSVSFASMPRQVPDLDRLFGTKISRLVEDGGTMVIYGVESGTLLPRPRAVFVVPADDARRQAIAELTADLGTVQQVLGFRIDAAERNGELIVSFDPQTKALYLKDAFSAPPWPANRWAMRLDPERLAPILDDLSRSPTLRFAAPRIHRSARDLSSWTGHLRHARSIEAAASTDGRTAELRVRIESK